MNTNIKNNTKNDSYNNRNNSMYDVNSYSDGELYDILNLTNPTDRELEAKINSLIWKYTNIGNDSGQQLVDFFQDIYERFFESENDIETNEENDQITPSNILRSQQQDQEDEEEESYEDMEKINENSDDTKQKYTSELTYSKGSLNPLLQQTTKRIISIDSQYRSNKTSISTDFTFDLSDPLKDVVNLKLYSIQIPLTWYVINSNYGSNFLYLKGTSSGINNGDHDYKITIPVGNYTATELINAVNLSLQTLKTNPLYSDTKFGNTNITYDYPSSKASFNIDIFKHYNENFYTVEFQEHSSPNILDRTISISSFLGFNRASYNIYTLFSNLSVLPLTTSVAATIDDINVANYTLTATNNSFQIVHYIPNDITSGIYDYNSGSIIDTIVLTLDLPIDTQYSRNDLFNEVNRVLQNNSYLTNLSALRRIDETNSNIIGYNHSHYELDIRVNRKTISLVENSKLSVVFPDDSTIWTGLSSAFVFDNSINDMSSLYAETKSLESKYIINSSPYIKLRCVKSQFENSLNDYIINVANSSQTGYTINEIVDAINEGIRNTNDVTRSYNLLGDFKLNNTRAYIDGLTSQFTMQVDLTRTFNQNDYMIDFSNSVLVSLMGLTSGRYNLSNDIIFNGSFPVSGAGYNIESTQTLFTVSPNISSGNSNINNYVLKPSIFKLYIDINELEQDLNSQFANFLDSDSYPVLQGTNITLIQNGNIVDATLTINVRKYLTQNDYIMEFVDPNADLTWSITDTNNSWAYFLQLHQMSFLLNNPLYNIDNTSYSRVVSTNAISGNIIYLNSFNNKIFIRPVNLENGGNGIYDANDENSVILELPTNVGYNRDQLINVINNSFASTYGSNSLLKLYKKGEHNFVKLCLNINRTYKASDYRVVFYDPLSFTTFSVGTNIVTNTTWDSTLGWILGFRISTEYFLADYSAPSNTTDYSSDMRTITGDNVVSVTLYNYFMILLDDFNQNHLNDGIVTTTQKETLVKTPSYYVKSDQRAHPITGELMTNTIKKNGQNMTQNEIYAAQELLNAQKNVGTENNVLTSNDSSRRTIQYYSSGPFSKNVFALVPLKISGSQNNSIFVEFGGTLQNQQRNYFGPVNIQRMNVRLVNDRGALVDLNGANWSFSFICEQLYQQKSL